MTIKDIARYEEHVASNEIKKVKDEANALTLSQKEARQKTPEIKLRGLKQGGLWDKYAVAKQRARLALTMIAIIKETEGEELPKKGELFQRLKEHGWKRAHAPKGKMSTTVVSALKMLAKNKRRLDSGIPYPEVDAWNRERSKS